MRCRRPRLWDRRLQTLGELGYGQILRVISPPRSVWPETWPSRGWGRAGFAASTLPPRLQSVRSDWWEAGSNQPVAWSGRRRPATVALSETAQPTNAASVEWCAQERPMSRSAAPRRRWIGFDLPTSLPPPIPDTPVCLKNEPTPRWRACGIGYSRNWSATRSRREPHPDNSGVCEDSWHNGGRRRNEDIRPRALPPPVQYQFAAIEEKIWNLAGGRGTLWWSLVLVNQRLPQRVRLFKFLEGDIHRPITLFDRPRC